MIHRSAQLVVALALGSQAAAGAEPPGYSVPMQEQDSGAYSVRGVLGDVETELLVDTGSSYVALSAETFSRLERQQGTSYRRTIRGAMAGGRVVEVKVYVVAELALGDSCVLQAVEVVVLPGADRDILGLSALRRLQPFALDLERPALRFTACRASVVAGHTATT